MAAENLKAGKNFILGIISRPWRRRRLAGEHCVQSDLLACRVYRHTTLRIVISLQDRSRWPAHGGLLPRAKDLHADERRFNPTSRTAVRDVLCAMNSYLSDHARTF